MVQQITLGVYAIFQACVGWFERIFSVTGMTKFYLACIAMMLAYKFLLAPLFGSHSDKARKVED